MLKVKQARQVKQVRTDSLALMAQQGPTANRGPMAVSYTHLTLPTIYSV